jgi:hypothetical protein
MTVSSCADGKADLMRKRAFFLLIRAQTAIHDEQFLKSMIPHRAERF